MEEDFKYLGLYLGRQLTWRKHIETKRQLLNLKLRAMSWLLPRRSQLSRSNKTSYLQMYPQARVEIRNSTVGMCKALSHTNPSTLPVQNPTFPC